MDFSRPSDNTALYPNHDGFQEAKAGTSVRRRMIPETGLLEISLDSRHAQQAWK
jgi:hypothetical protein